MLGKAKKHAKRVGTVRVKVLFSIQIVSINIPLASYNNDNRKSSNNSISDGTILSVCFERGGKIAATSDIVFSLEKYPAHSNTITIPFHEKVELMATLYQDSRTAKYQEKVGKVILRQLKKNGLFGIDSHRGLGLHSLSLHSLAAEVDFQRGETSKVVERILPLQHLSGGSIRTVITTVIDGDSDETMSVVSGLSDASDVSNLAASFSHFRATSTNKIMSPIISPGDEGLHHPRSAAMYNDSYCISPSRTDRSSHGEDGKGRAELLDGSNKEVSASNDGTLDNTLASLKQPLDADPNLGTPTPRTAYTIGGISSLTSRSPSSSVASASYRTQPSERSQTDGSRFLYDNQSTLQLPSSGSEPSQESYSYQHQSQPFSQESNVNLRKNEGGSAASSIISSNIGNEDSSNRKKKLFAFRNKAGIKGGVMGNMHTNSVTSIVTDDEKDLRNAVAPRKKDGSSGTEMDYNSNPITPSTVESSTLSKSFLKKISHFTTKKSEKKETTQSNNEGNFQQRLNSIGATDEVNDLNSPWNDLSLSSTSKSRHHRETYNREAFQLYNAELEQRAERCANLEQRLSEQAEYYKSQIKTLRAELHSTEQALRKERVARSVIADVTSKGDAMLAASLSVARDEAATLKGELESAQAQLQSCQRELVDQKYENESAINNRNQEMKAAQEAANAAVKACLRRSELEEENEDLISELISMKVAFANLSMDLDAAKKNNLSLRNRIQRYAGQIASMEVRYSANQLSHSFSHSYEVDT